MKFDLISDFHVEFNVAFKRTASWREGNPFFYAWHLDKKSDVLVIPGDISNEVDLTCGVVLEAAEYYKHVIFVDGNHDHYGGWKDPSRQNYHNNIQAFRNLERAEDNITFLDEGNNFVMIDNTMFTGACGWYDYKAVPGVHPRQQRSLWRQHSNDPTCIRFGKKNRPEKLAVKQADSLRDRIDLAQDRDEVEEIVVCTHTIPHKGGLINDPTHKWYQLNGSYMNTEMYKVWEADKNDKIRAWVFGHTHFQYDYIHRHIRFVTNPRGYRGERRRFGGFDGIKQIDTGEAPVGSAFGEIEK